MDNRVESSPRHPTRSDFKVAWLKNWLERLLNTRGFQGKGLLFPLYSDFGFTLISSQNDAIRGGQISYTHEQAYAIMQALIASKVIGDFRAPDCVRFGVSPLYLCYTDIWQAVDTIKSTMEQEAWQKFQGQRKASVT